jgi:hypothetical protein
MSVRTKPRASFCRAGRANAARAGSQVACPDKPETPTANPTCRNSALGNPQQLAYPRPRTRLIDRHLGDPNTYWTRSATARASRSTARLAGSNESPNRSARVV